MKKSDGPIVVEVFFDVSIEKVWKALTNLDEMKRWYFENIDAFKPELGSKSRFAVQSGNRTFTHLWEVTKVDAPHKIVYNWKYEEYQGDSFVTFNLNEIDGRTKLILELKVVEDFPDEIPEFARESCIGGWNYFIGGRLKDYLGKSK
jgi:uncharacterized protein YndB with AHSA1/START domain